MGGFVTKIRSVAAQVATAAKKAASALWESITRAARAAASYISSMFRAAFDALKRAAAAAARFNVPKEAKIAIAVVGAVAAVLCLLFCFLPGGAMMVAPGGGGLMVLRSAFDANAALYFAVLRVAGPVAAAASLI
ncbi:unnamed protein product [Urochloa humidicola]